MSLFNKLQRLVATLISSVMVVLSVNAQLAACNCSVTPPDCVNQNVGRAIVDTDTSFAHHSYCHKIFYSDKAGKTILDRFICNEKPDGKFLLQFYDSSTLGTIVDTWYDTSGMPVYMNYSQNNVVKECYWYHYQKGKRLWDYITGYRNGERFKESYSWDEYEATYTKKVVITAKSITTIVYTDKQDEYGNYVLDVSTVANKSGKIE